ncbi:hypothetical protein BpHYR1_001959 [Brachionus plicatilis]|uniref:Uncharacterized protein n=1 Tax=Brachionus plicatilis TaxID=10195 RepID=A0A3M7RU42_BRAPC|nr:hypothetical protein BpHYR1_001959 [Brachionus plicatilis]
MLLKLQYKLQSKLQWIYQENEEDQRNQQLREKNKKKLIFFLSTNKTIYKKEPKVGQKSKSNLTFNLSELFFKREKNIISVFKSKSTLISQVSSSCKR